MQPSLIQLIIRKLLNHGMGFDWQSVTKITDPNCALDYLIIVLQDLTKRSTTNRKNYKYKKKYMDYLWYN